MHRTLVGALLVAMLTPLASGQFLADPSGDVRAEHFEGTSTPVSGWESMDLLALDLNETPEAFRFKVKAGVINQETRQDRGNYFVHFAHGQVYYVLRLLQAVDNGAPFGSLFQVSDANAVWGQYMGQLPASIDPATQTIWADVPRRMVLDENGAPPERGHALTNLFVDSEAHVTGISFGGFMGLQGGPAIIGDVMPDAERASWPIQWGGSQVSGPVQLSVDRPYRASNGEETTYKFQVTLANLDSRERWFDAKAVGLPSNWQLHMEPAMRVPGDGAVTMALFLSTPFAHQHGQITAFELQYTRRDDPSVQATREIGIHYHAIPQPAGHHNTLYLHSRAWSGLAGAINPLVGGTSGVLFMNTLEKDDGDDQGPTRASSYFGSDRARHSWSACLQPDLAMGLVVDGNSTGAVTLPVKTTEPILDGSLSGRLLLLHPGEPFTYCMPWNYEDRQQTVLAELEATTVSLDAASAKTVSAPLLPAAGVGRIDFKEGMVLVLEVEITDARPAIGGAAGIDLMPGGYLEVPLLEYHESARPPSPTSTTAGANGTEEASKRTPAPASGLLVAGLLALAAAAAPARSKRFK
jgi:hypothetical protein